MDKKILGSSSVMNLLIPYPSIDLENDTQPLPNKNPIQIRTMFDFVDQDVIYLEESWWHVDMDTGIIHIEFPDIKRKKYIELMKKQFDNGNMTRDEELELETLHILLSTLPTSAAENALQRIELYQLLIKKSKEYEADDKDKKNKSEEKIKKQYRTTKRAGDVAEIPTKMPLITNQTYINAMTYNNDNAAYLQPLTSADGLLFKDGKLFFEGLPASAARIKHLYAKNNMEEFDLPLLRVFYAIILNKFKQTWIEDRSIDETITIYYPDLAKNLGKKMNISRTDVETTINSILSFRNIIGITEKGNNILPVLVYMGEDRDKNTITFASPYIVKIIKDLYKASVRKNKQGLELKKKDGTPQMLPAYTYLPDLTLAKERNKKAVEIVCIIIPVIENAGSHGTPHISARTIIERNQLLKQSLENTSDKSNQNKILKRAFSKAWELLITQTDITKRYKNIQLPIIPGTGIKDPKEKKRQEKEFQSKWIPTMSTLDMVFEFPHEGKIKD